MKKIQSLGRSLTKQEQKMITGGGCTVSCANGTNLNVSCSGGGTPTCYSNGVECGSNYQSNSTLCVKYR